MNILTNIKIIVCVPYKIVECAFAILLPEQKFSCQKIQMNDCFISFPHDYIRYKRSNTCRVHSVVNKCT